MLAISQRKITLQCVRPTTGADSCSSMPGMWSRTQVPLASGRALVKICCKVTPSTAARYLQAPFEEFFSVRDIAGVACLTQRGLPCLVERTVRYLRVSFHAGVLSASRVGTLMSALRR